MPPRKSHARAYLMLGVVMVFWAGNSIVGRAMRDDVGPFTLSFMRWFIACLVLLPLAARKAWAERAIIRAGWLWIAILGALGVVLFNALLYNGLRYTTATNALLLQASIPAMVLAVDRVLEGTRAPALQVAAVLLSTLGVVTIVLRGDLAAIAGLPIGRGDAMILIAALAWALYIVFLRRKPAVSPAVFLLLTFSLGVLTMAPPALLETLEGRNHGWSLRDLGGFVYVGIFPSVVAFYVFNAATEQLGPARAGQGITLMPLFGALLSTWLLGEHLERFHWIGMAMILGGIVLAALVVRRRTEPQNAGGAGAAPPLEDRP
ncbi:DMT family transporter [Novosphingobium colocasiae]|uniref:Multidrug DMT transporter permease n=1 Tax=Novosphingobium colocasiae TaxID=1256513 RepID=A0A918UDR5_9SPHN|nr:DMT family transporter [Novosphingobium colocasiae]GGY92874.1 multidrug DMT transporter permease [Novosphingobium colocasiae]